MSQCTLCIKRRRCKFLKDAEQTGVPIVVCKYYEEESTCFYGQE